MGYHKLQLVFGATFCLSPPPQLACHPNHQHLKCNLSSTTALFFNQLFLKIKALKSLAISDNVYPKIKFHHYGSVYMVREPNGANLDGND